MSRRALSGALALGLVLTLLGVPRPAWAVDDPPPAEIDENYEEESEYGPIQRRLFGEPVNHELSLGWAYLPLDPYSKGYGLQLAYTVHFDELIALEILRVGWAHNQDTSLKTKLIEQLPDVSPAEFPAVVLFTNTNLLFKIFYGKQSLLNLVNLHFELFLTVGASLLLLSPFNLADAGESGYADTLDFQFGLNGGLGFRIWFDPTWSLRVDLRDTVSLLSFTEERFPFDNSALIGFSIAVNL